MSESNSPAEVAVSPRATVERSSLGRWLLFAGLLVVVGGGLTALAKWLPREGLNGGTIEFPARAKALGPPGKAVLNEDPIHRFGVMPQATEGTHTWELKNEGPGEIIISQGATTCSCLIASLKGKKDGLTLKAGESTPIILTWQTRDNDGAFERSSDINVINDPDREVYKLVVKGTVRPAVAVMPEKGLRNLQVIPVDKPNSTTFAIASADKPDLKVLSVTTTSPDEIVAKAVPLPATDKKALQWEAMPGGHLIEVELKPTNRIGPFADDVIVITDHPQGREIKLRVSGHRTGPVSFTHPTVLLHGVDSDEGGTFSMMVTVQDGADTNLEVAEKPDTLKVEVVPVDVKVGSASKVRQFRLIVTVPPGTAPCVIDDPIVLKSNHPAAARVTVPVDISVIERP